MGLRRRRRPALALALALAGGAPAPALACACGCGVFDVGDVSLPMASDSGFSAWFRYGFMDQDQNWEGSHRAPLADNTDRGLKTSFFTFGGQYMIDRRWTVIFELPLYDRDFAGVDDGSVAGPAGSVYHAHETALGDLQLMGVWTGLSPDLSTGLTFGVKLPTGDWHGPRGPRGGRAIDRDTLPGTGSTDLMIGGYHFGDVTRDGKLSWFLQARYQVAIADQDDYRPGDELDTAVGLTWQAASFGREGRVTPVLQVIDSWRRHDTGASADPVNTGYERVLIAPGANLRLNRRLLLHADVELPLYQHFNAAPDVAVSGKSGQLAAPVLIKTQVSYNF
ncbi:MAG TPA: hypothetical protein VG248_18290 [Caulobacteraceae bacterium]|nr:hypothetical protein [Caulobacteraceae bacterium]